MEVSDEERQRRRDIQAAKAGERHDTNLSRGVGDVTKAKKGAKAKAKAAGAKAAAKVTVGLYELGDAGECTSALGMLRAKGWEVGSVLLLREKQKDCNLEDVFHISSVDGSGVALRTTGGQSDVTLIIEATAFLGLATQVPSDRVVMHSSWPGSRICKSKAFAEAAVRSRVLVALETLAMKKCYELEALVDNYQGQAFQGGHRQERSGHWATGVGARNACGEDRGGEYLEG